MFNVSHHAGIPLARQVLAKAIGADGPILAGGAGLINPSLTKEGTTGTTGNICFTRLSHDTHYTSLDSILWKESWIINSDLTLSYLL